MTDKEMAEVRATKFADINFNEPDNYGSAKEIGYHAYYAGFLAGLEAGRPKWHKVADGDLPEAENHFWSKPVLFQTSKGSLMVGFYDHAVKAWYHKATNHIMHGVIAWCEIPRYMSEEEA